MVNLTYRELNAEDFSALHEIATLWPVVRQLGSWPWPPKPEFTLSRCKPYGGKGFVWGICIADKLVGSIAVTGGELGYMLHPKTAGRGVMTRAATDAMEHARLSLGVTDFEASVWHDNPASKRVLEKLGFFHWQTGYVMSAARGIPTQCYYLRTMGASATS
ncbi:GNAT family N-acetyltransferase [bacterium]|nr:GNAT family N-acetyltransferase [bacterium]